MYDNHTAALSILLKSFNDFKPFDDVRPLEDLPINWIPLDVTINDMSAAGKIIAKSGNDLTNDFFIQQGIPLRVSDDDIKNKTVDAKKIALRQKVVELKEKFKNEIHAMPYKEFIEKDLKLYLKTLDSFYQKYNTRSCPK